MREPAAEPDVFSPPGAWMRGEDSWGRFSELVARIPEGALFVIDRKVEKLHPKLARAVKGRRPRAVVSLPGGERVKSLVALERVLIAGRELSRGGTLVAVGGGTIGDLGTVAAHLLKRGVRLIQVPTTVLAAVDSSLGGKGALDLASRGLVIKNLAGAFHSAEQCLIAPEFFETLTAAQRREGAIEAWKMIVCLDEELWRRTGGEPLSPAALIREARRIKGEVCGKDPYERTGLRRVLNFGHTFGHVLESLSNFRLPHGEAVGLGMLCALDLGRQAGVTAEALAWEVEQRLIGEAGVRDRRSLAKRLSGADVRKVDALLAADKKVDAEGRLQMVLLERVGSAVARPLARAQWVALLRRWQEGVRP